MEDPERDVEKGPVFGDHPHSPGGPGEDRQGVLRQADGGELLEVQEARQELRHPLLQRPVEDLDPGKEHGRCQERLPQFEARFPAGSTDLQHTVVGLEVV